MSNIFLVNVEPPEIRVAYLIDHRLMDLFVEREERLLGNIYKGRIEDVVPGMDAAFVNIGLKRNALIYAGDVVGGSSQDGGREGARGVPPIAQLVRPRQEMLVQIARPPVGTKGARVTARLSLAGRYCVMANGTENIGVSRRIESEDERRRLRRIAEKIRPLDHGLILRTEAENASEAELAADVRALWQQLSALKQRSAATPAPALLHQDLGLLGRLVRDRLNESVDALVVDSEAVFAALQSHVQALAPQLMNKIHLHYGRVPVFEHYGVAADMATLSQRVVSLPSGGSLSIDETEALTAIDVNTGKFTGKIRLSETVLQTNLEAVEEAARQIRLRGIGGVIVIDLIDMERSRDQIKVMNALEAALKHDHTRTRIVELSPLGLVEMTRRREGQSLRQLGRRPCPTCAADGTIKTVATIAIETRRRIRDLARRSPGIAVRVTLHPQVGLDFLGNDAEYVSELEAADVQVWLHVDPALHQEATQVEVFSPSAIPENVAPFTSGEHVMVPAGSFFDGAATPPYVVVQNMMVLLSGEAESAALPAVIEITDVKRWFATARTLVRTANDANAPE